ncbi:uncharacterized protein STEHIDRAFT_110555 [Stereum hirsutum FP-91666 SS1]|uniref:uncharacterized protein n=1 Tax=Stereum hirsutum (strain FP-91666) TaxID=721885 RepID=UPI000440DC0E|nr:uncharacterized protein STEHIDRAFT_110555 [Stereum hirsutum FP-91666 SS1]EIM87317.1 hypothetical protein STEHIDRAFT_110555 [Stereum hirsutum FP-91666 SS1]
MSEHSDHVPSEEQTAHLHEAGPPFDALDADIVIRSSDDYVFRLHRTILSVASIVFKDMFSAQAAAPVDPASGNPNFQSADWYDGLPVVLLTEDRKTLDILFKLIYPIDNPPLTTISAILKVISLTDKFMIESLSDTIGLALSRVAQDAPHVVWAIARKRGLQTTATKALFLTIQHPTLAPPLTISNADLDSCLTASDIRELQLWQNRCAHAAVQEAIGTGWVRGAPHDLVSDESPGSCICLRYTQSLTHTSNKENPIQTRYRIAQWVSGYLSSSVALLRVTPHWETIRDVPTYPHLRKVSECPFCGEHAHDALRVVISGLEWRIKMAIQKVASSL